jgi:hypothetical protein
MGKDGTPTGPVYTKVKQDDGAATALYFINVDEGWRSWILCGDMYEWAADQLIEKLAGTGGWRH